MRPTPELKLIGHISPYRRIDPRYPCRKKVITKEDIQNGERVPDAAIYRYDPCLSIFILKDGV